jgi:hypothetical protein
MEHEMMGKVSNKNSHRLNNLLGVFLVFQVLLGGCQTIPADQIAPFEAPILSTSASEPSSAASQAQPAVSPPAAEEAPPAAAATATLPSPPSFPVTGIELWQANSAALEIAVAAGAFWIRRNSLMWSRVEPDEVLRNWGALAGLENEIISVNKSGSRMVLIVSSTPSWAQAVPGTACGPIAQEKLLAFSQFMNELVLRYSAPPFGVKYWELGNEPDIDPALVSPDSLYGCWGDADDPYYGGAYYAEMLKQVYPQIKSADPEAQVLVGGLLMDCDPVNPPEGKSCQPSLFLEGILRSGGGDYFDGISFHGYDYYAGENQYANPNWHSSWDTTGPVLGAKTRYLKSLLASYQIAGKFLMNTESGLMCGSSGNEPLCQAQEFGQTKAYYALESNLAAQAEGLRANIWYTLYGWRGTALVDKQTGPLPAYAAYIFSARQLSGLAVIRAVTDISGVRGYELGRGDRRGMVLWAVDGQEHSFEFEEEPTAIFNIFGDSSPVVKKIAITRQPLYIEW